MAAAWDDAFDRLEKLIPDASRRELDAAARMAVVVGREAARRVEELSAENAALRAYLRDHASNTAEAH